MLQRSPLSSAVESILVERGGLAHNFMGLPQEDKNILKKVLKKLDIEPTPKNLEIIHDVWVAGYNAIHSYTLPNE